VSEARGAARRKPPERPEGQGWRSRLAAADLVERVCDGGADLDGAMAASAEFDRLEGADRAFARSMASAFLRARGRIDLALRRLTERPDEDIDPSVRALLRIGCAQLWVMNAADYATVSATVEAARHSGGARRAGGFINAVLRRAARERDVYDMLPASAVWPAWIAAKLTAAAGAEGAERMARLQLEDPTIDLSFRDLDAAHRWAELGHGVVLPNGSVRLHSAGNLTTLPGYEAGEWWVQDAAAAIAVRLLAPGPGMTALDACAAPGGKTMQIAATGARTLALDISRQRIALLRDNLLRTGLEAEVIEADVRNFSAPAPFDRVLLDAPCSALGVLRRHPEGAFRRRPADIARFPEIQMSLVRAMLGLTAAGGIFVYCVCTPCPEEGEEIIEGALAAGGWRRVPADPSELPGFAHAVTARGDVLTVPPGEATGALTSDVFFISRLMRI
jgi:16S rRNA (cytosine967-C5)-methyltransferase